MALTQVQPVRLFGFLRRRNFISLVNNVVKDQVYDRTSSSLQCYSRLSSASKKKLQFLVNKIHPEYESLNFVGCQSSFKSLASVNPYTICMFSTNCQLSMKDQSSQSTICKPKGTYPACSTAFSLHVIVDDARLKNKPEVNLFI